MAEGTDDTKVDATTTDSSPDKTNDQVSTKDTGGKEPMIPKHRLDEEAAKAKAAESRAEKAERSAAEAVASSKAVEAKLASLATALAGGDITKKEANAKVEALAAKYDVKPEFFTDVFAEAKAQALAELQPHLKQVQASNDETGFKNELEKLLDEVPESADLSSEDKAELKKRAFSKEFLNTPLKSVYRDMMFDKPRGKARTAESSRGGNKTPSDGKVDISAMSLEEFEKFSNDMGKRT
jgi:hypothetical protein